MRAALGVLIFAPFLSLSEPMPRPSTQRIIGADVPTSQQRPVGLDVVASPANTMVQAGPNEYQQLADALGKVHAPIAAMQERKNALDQKNAVQEGLANAAREQNLGLIKDNPEPPPSATVPPAYQEHYAEAYRKGVGQRLAQSEHDSYLESFVQEYQKEGFNKTTFDAQWRQRSAAGVTDPIVTAEMLGGLDRAMSSASQQMTIEQQKKIVEARSSMLSASLNGIDENTTAPAAMEWFQRVAKDHTLRGGTRTEAATALFTHMAGLSMKLGGRPDLFSVFDQEVPGLGQKLVDLVPGFKDKVYSEQHAAEEMRRRTIHEQTFVQRGVDLDHVNKMVEDGSLAQMPEEERVRYLNQYAGVNGALSPMHVAETLHKVRAQIAAKQDTAAVLWAFNNGAGATLSPDVAKKGLKNAFNSPSENLGGASVMQALTASLADPQKAGQLLEPTIAAILNAHDRAQVGFPDDTIKQIVNSVVLDIPKEGGDVSPKFQALSRLYAELGRRSKPLQSAYFDDKAGHIFDAYNRLTVEGQSSSPTAYKQAYASVDPDNIRAARDMVEKDPVFKAQLHADARSAMRGLFAPGNGAWSPRFWPGAETLGLRPNTGALESWASSMALDYKKINPTAGADDVRKYVVKQTEANWFFEHNSSTMVQIPPAYNNQSAQEAISNYIGIIQAQPGNKDMAPRLISKGNGVYDLFFYPGGSPEKAADDVRIESIMALRTAQKNFSPAEREQLGALRNKIEAGTATAEDMRGAEATVAKARTSGVWSQDLQRKADELAVQSAMQKSMTTIEPALQTATKRAEFNPAAVAKPNGSLAAPTAKQFITGGDLAGALTTLGEGVRTQTYKDAAGHLTIGIGYNLSANAGTIADDFRRSGIPVDQIDEIKAGTRQITIDQAMRLYQAVKPRYEAIAKGAVDSRYPGEWPKLGDNVKAVLTDLAYQTGNVKQFATGLDNLFKGDLSGSGLEAKFKNKASGKYQLDERRHTLRTAMLSSTTLFQTLLNDAAKQPANAVQSRIARTGTP